MARMTTTAERTAMKKIRSRLLATLTRAMQERPDLQHHNGTEPDWAVYERTVMHSAVNAERAARGLPPVGVAQIRRCEDRAAGHGYVEKFALHCAWLAVGLDDEET